MTFIDSILNGTSKPEELDNWIDRWHKDLDTDLDLHDYLGFGWDEYRLMVQHPEFTSLAIHHAIFRKVTSHAADTFRRYEQLHRYKGTTDGDTKAMLNAKEAERFEKVLNFQF